MRTIIAGSRNICDPLLLENAVANSGFEISEVISGGAVGVDTLAIGYAIDNTIPLRLMEADWHRYGKSAGFVRNEQMARVADALIAVWDGRSKGTFHMIRTAKLYHLKIHVERVDL